VGGTLVLLQQQQRQQHACRSVGVSVLVHQGWIQTEGASIPHRVMWLTPSGKWQGQPQGQDPAQGMHSATGDCCGQLDTDWCLQQLSLCAPGWCWRWRPPFQPLAPLHSLQHELLLLLLLHVSSISCCCCCKSTTHLFDWQAAGSSCCFIRSLEVGLQQPTLASSWHADAVHPQQLHPAASNQQLSLICSLISQHTHNQAHQHLRAEVHIDARVLHAPAQACV